MPISFHRLAILVTSASLVLAGTLVAQKAEDPKPKAKAPESPVPQAPSPPPPDDGFTTLDSTVGYIDPAIPWTQLRFRYDSAYNFLRPNRAEFFYAKPKPTGPGLSVPETRIDYQEVNVYGEICITDRWSILAEMPARFLNPEANPNYYGFSDLTVGGKYAFVMEDDLVASVQVRVTSPTGDAGRGLGTKHVSIESGFLGWYKLNDRWGIEGELRYWAPVGGTDFAGDIMRYGIGVYHNLYLGDTLRIAPVAEFVGWTVFGGKERYLLPSGVGVTENAVGDTIVNAKLGLRIGMGRNNDMYVGYGHALTGDKWYQDVFRFELRRRF